MSINQHCQALVYTKGCPAISDFLKIIISMHRNQISVSNLTIFPCLQDFPLEMSFVTGGHSERSID